MKTDDLVAALASEATPVSFAAADNRFKATLGLAMVLVLAEALVFLGARSDLAAAAALPMFWLKLAFPASLAIAGLLALRRLSYPGTRLGRVPLGVVAPVGLLLSAVVLGQVVPGERTALILGTTWRECPVSIALISVPALGLALWAVRGLAPTRPGLAGAAAGLFAGASAALAYALHCPEIEAPFLAVWYALGMLLPTAAGALLGLRLLRW